MLKYNEKYITQKLKKAKELKQQVIDKHQEAQMTEVITNTEIKENHDYFVTDDLKIRRNEARKRRIRLQKKIAMIDKIEIDLKEMRGKLELMGLTSWVPDSSGLSYTLKNKDALDAMSYSLGSIKTKGLKRSADAEL